MKSEGRYLKTKSLAWLHPSKDEKIGVVIWLRLVGKIRIHVKPPFTLSSVYMTGDGCMGGASCPGSCEQLDFENVFN